MRLIALDPGGSTGFAAWENGEIIKEGTLTGDHYHQLWSLLFEVDQGMKGELLIICERFDNRGKIDAKLVSLEYIGVVKLYSQMSMAKVAWQSPSIKPSRGQGKGLGWADNKKLSATGLIKTPISSYPHLNDAYRHLLFYICHYKGMDQELMRWQDRYFYSIRNAITRA